MQKSADYIILSKKGKIPSDTLCMVIKSPTKLLPVQMQTARRILMRKKAPIRLVTRECDIVSCFDAAVHNAVNINTVRCRYSRYNKTGLLNHRYMLRAGRNYITPWTRDASINTWQAMNFIASEVSRTTLFAVCDVNKKGEPVIQPDVQTWDQIVWSVGAYNYYLVTGDEDFLRIAHGIIGRALEAHRKNRFNKSYGLFVGGSFFNDGISGYPLSCHQQGLKDSFAPSHPVVETIMCLSTNCLYCQAYRIYGELSELLGFNDKAATAKMYREELKDTINRVFWSDQLNRYRYILFPDGKTDNSQELSGHAFAVLFDICPEEKKPIVFENLAVSSVGTASIWPPFEGIFSDDKPGRHNNVIWPFLNGLIIEAAAQCGLYGFVGEELKKITELFKGSKFKLFEIYSPYTQKTFGGWQTGRVWDSCRDQTWSATCYIGAFIYGVFGISIQEKGISFFPCVPENLRDSELNGIKIRGCDISVKIHGYGNKIDKFLLDGKEREPFVQWDSKPHKIEIVMSCGDK